MQAANPVFNSNCLNSESPNPAIPTLHLSGEYDSFNTPALWSEIERVLQGDGDGLILDASDVTFFDASGVHVLVTAAQQLAALSQRLTLRNPSHCVDRVLRICGLEALGHSAPDPTEQ